MKKFFIGLFFLFSLNSFAQFLCDSMVVSGSNFQISVSASPDVFFISVSTEYEGDYIVLEEDSSNTVSLLNNVYFTPEQTLAICAFSYNDVCCQLYNWNGDYWVVQSDDYTPSWNCSGNAFGCLDPADGSGQFATYEECVAYCDFYMDSTATFTCNPVYGCYNPFDGSGEYSTVEECEAVCELFVDSLESYNCDGIFGCFNPGDGSGEYSSFEECIYSCGIITDSLESYNCDPVYGCYNPGEGSGTFSTLEECLAVCDNYVDSLESYNCDGIFGCFNPGDGSGEYSSFIECINSCGLISDSLESYNCDPVYGCYNPGDGSGEFESLEDCYDECSTSYNPFCDSLWYDAEFVENAFGNWNITMTGFLAESANDFIDTVINSFIVSPSNDFMSQYGFVGCYPNSWTLEDMEFGLEDTVTICWTASVEAFGLDSIIADFMEDCFEGESMMCEDWYWDGDSWARSTAGTTSIKEPYQQNRTLLKVIDALGRESRSDEPNRLLFYIYDNGDIEKKFIIK